jgi:hypothetical protein
LQNPFPINVHCANIGGDAWDVIAECEYPIGSVSRVKGVVFRDMSPGWNTVVKSASC